MPTRASTRSWLRPANASSSSRFTWDVGSFCGRRLSPSAARRAQPAPGSVPGPEVGQAAADPRLARVRVVAPLFGVAQAALFHVVAVDHPDLDLARGGAVGRAARGEFAIGGDADLLVALELQVGHRVGLPVFGV